LKIVKFLAILAVMAVLSGAALGYFLLRPYAGFHDAVFIQIPKGASTRAIAGMLAEAGVVEYPWEFLLARAARPSMKLQAGEFRFAAPATALEVYGRIARGDVFYEDLVIPEGRNMFDIGAIVEGMGLMPAAAFLAAARDPALIRDLDPSAPTLEGYLFPDTYRVTRHTGARELCRIFTQRFRAEWKRLKPTASPHDTVTLASLVEKEAAAQGDRPLIASVFQNRLRLGMKLDCDPTTVYAAVIEGRYRGVIHKSDLASENRYNTYTHAGLPPGPIANPGVASLKAAVQPAETDYLYFVARPDGSGRHEFSKDMAGHRVAVERYRRGVAK
jgi:UPF0755 protein